MNRGEVPVELEIQEAEEEMPAARGRVAGGRGRGSLNASSDKGGAVKGERDSEHDDDSEDENRCGL